MPKDESINQNLPADALPNFRNLGATLRIVLLVNAAALLAAIAQATSWPDIYHRFIDIAAFVQPVLLTSLLALYVVNIQLRRFTYRQGVLLVIALVAAITLTIAMLGADLFTSGIINTTFYGVRNSLLSMALVALLLEYFKIRAMSLARALHDARLQVLQARIRPHFLFNSINAVLSIVRSDPKRAETALEDMSDLFRMAMADNLEMVPLRHEIELSRQYLALEKLRLGERLRENWHIDDAAYTAMVPPFMLQPLLENAVYHGIEPLEQGGIIEVSCKLVDKELHLEVTNPCHGQCGFHKGNKMALANIRERLALKFDVEAKYTVESVGDHYHVHIQLPYIKEKTHE